eukprot:5940199-Pleurochrysis_carterae.AAC.2
MQSVPSQSRCVLASTSRAIRLCACNSRAACGLPSYANSTDIWHASGPSDLRRGCQQQRQRFRTQSRVLRLCAG